MSKGVNKGLEIESKVENQSSPKTVNKGLEQTTKGQHQGKEIQDQGKQEDQEINKALDQGGNKHEQVEQREQMEEEEQGGRGEQRIEEREQEKPSGFLKQTFEMLCTLVQRSEP
eukprot:TRINITY_DN59749_c0_g1_i1.p1 TRINITY_DN59749_c0_g1~~TRINITY_DN59749_c0_g1_i1.p1  ORF type:complete len:114 (-),score=21.01 TRINITY_DN59749_c0_g1_i1:124-465(-)